MIITRPNHDVTTTYLFAWSEALIALAHKRGFSVTDLHGKRANRKEFAGVLQKTQPTFVVINGHGDRNTVTGQDNEMLVEAGKNEELFAGKIIYARSCQSAAGLGKSCVKKGTQVYIGYTEDFVFFIDETFLGHPQKDGTAGLFLEPANQIVISLLKGHSAAEANHKSKEAYTRGMQRLLTSETPKEDKELVPYLRWNMIHQVCLGDGSAKIE